MGDYTATSKGPANTFKQTRKVKNQMNTQLTKKKKQHKKKCCKIEEKLCKQN